MAQVIGKDNLDRDYNGGKSEEVVATGLTPEAAVALCLEKNKGATDQTSTWYVVKPDEYKPYVFEGY